VNTQQLIERYLQEYGRAFAYAVRPLPSKDVLYGMAEDLAKGMPGIPLEMVGEVFRVARSEKAIPLLKDLIAAAKQVRAEQEERARATRPRLPDMRKPMTDEERAEVMREMWDAARKAGITEPR
jgi:hypothetical protein